MAAANGDGICSDAVVKWRTVQRALGLLVNCGGPDDGPVVPRQQPEAPIPAEPSLSNRILSQAGMRMAPERYVIPERIKAVGPVINDGALFAFLASAVSEHAPLASRL